MTRTGRRKIVLLGMMTKMPVAGVVWETAAVPARLRAARVRRLLRRGARAHAGALMLRRGATTARRSPPPTFASHYRRSGSAIAGPSTRSTKRSQRARDERARAHAPLQLRRGDREPLRRAPMPRPEHYETGRLVLLDTDPVRAPDRAVRTRPQARSTSSSRTRRSSPGPRTTAGRAAGCRSRTASTSSRPACRSSRLLARRRRRLGPLHDDRQLEPALAQHRLSWRALYVEQGRRVPQVPGAAVTWESAVRACAVELRAGRSRAARVSADGRSGTALDVSTDLESYRSYLLGSRGEFTVAKDQNVRLKSGWFSDRSAAYLAAGRPVVTQDTGFGCALPTGEGLFAFETMDDIVAAIETIEADYARARRAAFDVAREYFDAQLVLGQMLEEMGVSLPVKRRRCHPLLPPTLELFRRLQTSDDASGLHGRDPARTVDPRYGRRPPSGPRPRDLGRRADSRRLAFHPPLPRDAARSTAASSISKSSSSTTARATGPASTCGSSPSATPVSWSCETSETAASRPRSIRASRPPAAPSSWC